MLRPYDRTLKTEQRALDVGGVQPPTGSGIDLGGQAG
jgi:hypothetical protein